MPAWIADVDLRETLNVEGERLRQAEGRLAAPQARIAAYQATENGDNEPNAEG